MNSGGVGPAADEARVTDGLVVVERATEHREIGLVATYTVTTENDRPVAVRVVNDLPEAATDGAGFHPAREPRWWTVEDGRLLFKETVGSAAPATFEFGLAVEGGLDDDVSLPAPEIDHSEPVGVTREGDRVVFPGADDGADAEGDGDGDVPNSAAPEPEEPRGGLLSGVRSAVFGDGEEEVVRASDLDPDAMVVSREGSPADAPTEPTQSHAENPMLTATAVPLADAGPKTAFSNLPTEETGTDEPTAETEPGSPKPDGERDGEVDTGGETEPDVLSTLLAELEDDAARDRLRAELGLDELERTREAVEELRAEVAALRAEVETTADANETTAARVTELCRAVDGLASDLGRDVAVVPPRGDPDADR